MRKGIGRYSLTLEVDSAPAFKLVSLEKVILNDCTIQDRLHFTFKLF